MKQWECTLCYADLTDVAKKYCERCYRELEEEIKELENALCLLRQRKNRKVRRG